MLGRLGLVIKIWHLTGVDSFDQWPTDGGRQKKDAPVRKTKVISLAKRGEDGAKSYLEKLLSEGARKMLQAVVGNEIDEYVEKNRQQRTETGQRSVVRNGYLPERELVTGIGPIKIQQPRVRNRKGRKFSSAILPRYLRCVPSIDALIPALYLKGISTGDFTEALKAILGERAIGAKWEVEYKDWNGRDLSQKRYVYSWADGIYFNVPLDEERSCVAR